MSAQTGNLIVEQPFDGEVIAEMPLASEADADAMLARAVAVFANRQGVLPAHLRVEILKRLVVIFEQQNILRHEKIFAFFQSLQKRK